MALARMLLGAGAAVAGAIAAVALLAPAPDPAPSSPPAAPAPQAAATAEPAPDEPAAAAPAGPAAAPASTVASVTPEAQAPAAEAPDPTAAAEPPAAEPPAAEPPAAEAAPELSAPQLDLARIEPDGAALFAGRAEPGARVEVRIAGAVAAVAEAGADGGFVAFGTAPEGGASRVELITPDGPAAADPVFLAAPAGDAPDAPPTVVLQTTPEGVELLQAPTRAANEVVTLDVLSYAESGDVEVSGRGEALRPLRIWADATMIAETSVRADGRWSARSSVALAPGTYVLRVEAIGERGQVLFTAASPFRREAPDRLALAEGDIVIQPGDSLWRIAERRYGQGVRYSLIFEANADRIRDPDLIYPGQVFSIPKPAAD